LCAELIYSGTSEGILVKELLKIASAIPGWPWPRVGYLLGIGLLYKRVINFEEALLLALLAIVIDRDKKPSSAPSSNLSKPKKTR
jgi:hypothetical protein